LKNQKLREKHIKSLKLGYIIASFLALLAGIVIYAFFRNINNMALFRFITKPQFLGSLYNPIKTETIWSNMFIYNLPYGLWCLSGLFFIRSVWLQNKKWRKIYSYIFIVIVMSYVLLKIPEITPGTFDVLDLVFMVFFAFIESLIFKLFIDRRIL